MFKMSNKVLFAMSALVLTCIVGPSNAEAGDKENAVKYVKSMVAEGARKSESTAQLCAMTMRRLAINSIATHVLKKGGFKNPKGNAHLVAGYMAYDIVEHTKKRLKPGSKVTGATVSGNGKRFVVKARISGSGSATYYLTKTSKSFRVTDARRGRILSGVFVSSAKKYANKKDAVGYGKSLTGGKRCK